MKVEKSLYLSPEVALENGSPTEVVDYIDVKSYDEAGKPIFNKKIKDRSILTNRAGADKVIFAIVFVIFAIHCITTSTPILWMLSSSFKSLANWDNPGISMFALPDVWEFENYLEALTVIQSGDASFGAMLFHTIYWVATTTAFNVFMPTMTAYVLSRYRFPGREMLYTIFITSMLIPIIGTSGAAIRFFDDLGAYDTLLFPIIASMGNGISGSLLVYYGYFKSISESYSEAARVDGAGHYIIFFRIILPQAIPLIITYTVTGCIGKWNDYMSILVYMPSWPTLASGLYTFEALIVRLTGGDYPVYFAGLIMSSIPPIILFALMSNKIMTSISIGGLKG